ncbi:MAG: LysR family transcriptional regulator [Bacteroidetes bacterium]|nr:LysR family transcriptional regulator [Bacteroidota bacterium]
MDFRLSVFISVAHNLSFTEAANELKISQPAITNHIKELEKQYDIKLFDRSNGRIKLTYAGEIFLSHAEKIIEKYKVLNYTMGALIQDSKGTLKIGANSIVSNYILPKICANFNSQNKNIGLSIHTGNNKQVEKALLEKKLDIAFFDRDYKKNELSYHLIKREELVVVTSFGNKNINEIISIDEFFTIPLILREKDSDITRAIDKTLIGKGLNISNVNVVMCIDNNQSILGVLRNSELYSILPKSAVKEHINNESLKIIDINDLSFVSKLYCTHLKDNQDTLRILFSNFVINSNIA